MTQSGFIIRGMIQSAHIDILGRVQLVVWLLNERLLYKHLVRTGSAARLGNSRNSTENPAKLFVFSNCEILKSTECGIVLGSTRGYFSSLA